MRRSRLWATDDAGSAALEFIVVGVILLIPLVYLVVVLGLLQEQTLGAEAAARHAARAIATAPDAATATARGDAVLDSIVAEYGLDANEVEVAVTCRPASASCPSAGTTIVVRVTTRVAMPLVPAVLGLDRAASVPVHAEAAQKVSRLWGTG